jgi:hypothetical protein
MWVYFCKFAKWCGHLLQACALADRFIILWGKQKTKNKKNPKKTKKQIQSINYNVSLKCAFIGCSYLFLNSEKARCYWLKHRLGFLFFFCHHGLQRVEGTELMLQPSPTQQKWQVRSGIAPAGSNPKHTWLSEVWSYHSWRQGLSWTHLECHVIERLWN